MITEKEQFMLILVYLGSVALVLIALLHFYWLFGGTWGEGKTTPRDKQGKTVVPTKLEILVSAFAFLVGGLLPLVALGVIPLSIPHAVVITLLVAGMLVFVGRGVVGLILSLNTPEPRTDFNRLNIVLYTPICAVLAVSYAACLWII